jgi:phosphatidylinositol dimannoside acyltransferase
VPRVKERLISAVFGSGWTLICRMPESWGRAAFMLGADVAWRRQGHGVQVLEENLRRVIAKDADTKELRRLSRTVMHSYARYYLEVFRIQVIPRDRLLGHGMHLKGEENLELTLECLKNGRGVIYGLPHMGNFEQAGAWVIANGVGSFTTVAERLKPERVYQRFLTFRQQLGFEVLPTTGGPHPFGIMAQRLRGGNLVCLVADRDLSETGVEVDFFGEKALFPAGPAALAVQTGAALMPVSCWFVGDTEWGGQVHDEIPVPESGTRGEKATVMTQQLASVFERAIKEHPQDWHMLQRVFVADLDPARLARRSEALPHTASRPCRRSHCADDQRRPRARFVSQRLDTFRVGCPDDRARRRGHYHHGRVDHIGGPGPSAEDSCGLGGLEPDRIDAAAGQKPAQAHLAACVLPRLADDNRGYPDVAAVVHGDLIARPHTPVVLIDGDQRTCIVEVWLSHSAPAACLPWTYSRSAAAISALAAASSSGVKAPCSSCHSASSRRPKLSRISRSAALAISRDSGMPASRAALLIALASFSSRVMVTFLLAIQTPYQSKAPPMTQPASCWSQLRLRTRDSGCPARAGGTWVLWP